VSDPIENLLKATAENSIIVTTKETDMPTDERSIAFMIAIRALILVADTHNNETSFKFQDSDQGPMISVDGPMADSLRILTGLYVATLVDVAKMMDVKTGLSHNNYEAGLDTLKCLLEPVAINASMSREDIKYLVTIYLEALEETLV